MREELITSGRMNPGIDPHLHIWHWHIPLYLFLGGLAAGLLFFAAYFIISGKQDKFPFAVKYGPIISLIAIVIGLIALILDLKHPAYFWQLLTTVRFVSPMSWGAWTLVLVSIVNLIWIFSYAKDIFKGKNKRFSFLSKLTALFVKPNESQSSGWEWKHKLIRNFEKYSQDKRKAWAWVMIILAIILGVYTGILLSAFNARPLWNTSILGPLFLVSGLSTGAALLMMLSKSHHEKVTFSRIDIMLIAIELFFIIHLFMGFLAGPEVQNEAAYYFLGGEFTVVFWVNVVIIGLIIPAVLETMELLKVKIPLVIPGILILWGGIMFRFIMVDAGQITRFLY
jgi:protein NrfD